MLYYFLTYLINIFRIGRMELWIVSSYFSETGKLLVGICNFYTFYLIIETFSIRYLSWRLAFAIVLAELDCAERTKNHFGIKTFINPSLPLGTVVNALNGVELLRFGYSGLCCWTSPRACSPPHPIRCLCLPDAPRPPQLALLDLIKPFRKFHMN